MENRRRIRREIAPIVRQELTPIFFIFTDIFHIGGTSYLHKSDYDLAHWDYWPLSVIYFNLKLLELPAGHRFRERFSSILDKYESSERLLELHPEFQQTWRYREMQTILDYTHCRLISDRPHT